MAHNTDKLAQRFKAALEAEAARERAKVEEREDEVAREQARAAHITARRGELFTEVLAFATALGFVKSTAKKSMIVLSFRENKLTFSEADEGASVSFNGSHDADVVQLSEEDEWRLVLHGQGGGSDEWPLFDAGLEELLVVALGLPRPEPEASPAVDSAPEPAAAPTSDAEDASIRPRALPANPAAREAIAEGRDLRTDPLPSPERRDDGKKQRSKSTAPPGSTVRDFTEFFS